MVSAICDHVDGLDLAELLRDPTHWSVLLPVILTVLFVLKRLVPSKLIPFTVAFQPYLSFEQAEELLEDDRGTATTEHNARPRWKATILALTGFGETLAWLAYGAYLLIDGECDAVGATESILIALTWLYCFIRAVTVGVVVPLDCVALYVTYLIHGTITLVIQFLNLAPRLSSQELLSFAVHIGVTLFSLALALSMPLVPPRDNLPGNDPNFTPEDCVTFWEWITFSWVWPLIRLGRKNTLNEDDVWNLSITMRSQPIFKKFTASSRATLLRRIWACNSSDLLCDFFLTMLTVIFNYTGPYFLQHILAAIESTEEQNTQAYIYAFLAFLCTLAKAQVEMQHLWFSRRAATRTRSELMAAIYDKALKRKDFSGVIDKDKNTIIKGTTSQGKDKDGGNDDPKPGADIGKIVNLMAGDASRISAFMSGIYFLYGPPLELVIALVYLYQLLGISAFSGFLVLIITWPLNTVLTRRSVRIQKGLLAARDKRMGVLNELISAVKFVKYFAWESRWTQRVLDAREVEMKWMIRSRMNQVVFFLLWASVPVLVSVITFATFVAQGGELTVSVAFTAIALFGMTRGPLNIIPAWAVQAFQSRVALDRIATFLAEEEVSGQVSSLKSDFPENVPVDGQLGIENASFRWNVVESVEKGKDSGPLNSPTPPVDREGDTSTPQTQEQPVFELRDLSITFPDGALTVVTGPTASGKTALLMALLGEMTMLPGSGRILMRKDTSKVDQYGHTLSISYAGQTPWLQHESIRDNILFGSPYDPDRYEAVIDCCALRPDLAILEDGDDTEIGARGVSLSGGQKARVALARAVYARTKYVLLDDPLSAVDSHTARYLFDSLFQGPLLANRTVILVTHHLDLVLPGTQYIVRMLDGRIDTQGYVHELQSEGILEAIRVDEIRSEPHSPILPTSPTETEAELTTHDLLHSREGTEVKTRKKPRKLVKSEHREVGGVKWITYNTYLKASSYYIWAFLGVIITLNQFINVGEKIWIKIWGEAYTGDSSASLHSFQTLASNYDHESVLHLNGHQSFHFLATNNKGLGGIDWPDAAKNPALYVGIYGAITFTTVLTTVISFLAQYTGALRASRSLFKKLLSSVIGATMRWYDITPQGRLLNRFGKDIESIDTTLAGSLQAVTSSMATFLASVITVAVIFPWFLVPAAVLGVIYRELTLGYLHTGRDIRRMESNSRSPIFSDFGEVIEGIVTVRAFSAEQRFLDGLHSKIDLTTKMYYMFWMMNRWLLFNFDVLGSATVLITTLFTLGGFVSAGTAGICITSTMSITQSMYWLCRSWTALELDLNSVERVVEYLAIPQEGSTPSNEPPAYWPSSSNKDSLVVIEDLEVKYAPELPSVLHGVSITLKAGERVGLLGRTGSGKSTLATSILRFVEPINGRIIIDGIDISTLSLHDLRSRITFIPQDATLFSGTLRSNIDPFGDHDDAECLDALRRAHVITDSQLTSRAPSRSSSRASSVHGVAEDNETVATSSSATEVDETAKLTLDTQISAAGSSLSHGQRQLASMARALLRKSNIIIMDEATSSIDFATDSKIQTTIREEFRDSLLITIAHRLRTVIDYDRLIILDQGKVAQFDTPYNLIRKEGIFRDMCLKSGTFQQLEAAAKEKAESDMHA